MRDRVGSRIGLALAVFISAAFWANLARSQSATTTEKPTFAVYGDMPYLFKTSDGRTDEQILNQEILPRLKSRPDIPFVVHVGDLGRPEFACADSWYDKTLRSWRNDLAKPVFYTPGDNEWKDCDRVKLQTRRSALGRLAALREKFFNAERIRGEYPAAWAVQQQPEQPENLTWSYDGVRFVTQHLISKDNGRKDVLLDDPVQAAQMAEQRDGYNRLWLNQAFELAAKDDTHALVLAMQHDPFGAQTDKRSAMERCVRKPAYREFCMYLQEAAAKLKKPVLLVHGDTNAYCLDQPFSVSAAPLLWRLNASGDYQVIDASLVTVDAADPIRPFKVTGLLSGAPVPAMCNYAR